MIKFQPINDQILIKLDVVEPSILERGVDDRPKILPSGTVVAVGRGTFVHGTGFIETQVKAGDRVAVSLTETATNLPLSDEKGQVYVSISESLILGKLDFSAYENDGESPWFQAVKKQERRIALT